MVEENQIERAQLLIQQQRYSEAEKILNDLLSQFPTSSDLLALTSEVALQLNKADKALELINSAISFSPDDGSCHYIKAKILIEKENYNDAESSLKEATSLDPEDSDSFAFWASIKLARKDYQQALNLANQALSIEPENILGLNTRSSALIKLDNKTEAFNTIEGALKEDPNNSYTHANYGWGLLEKGEHIKALSHFQEALVNEPNNEMAQAGMAEALKARYFIFRLFLKYAFWMSNMRGKSQWGIIIGFYFAVKGLRALANSYKALAPYLTPIVIGLSIIAFSTWVINPISNLFLRFNKYGVHLLENYEKKNSNLVGISFIVFLIGISGYIITSEETWLTVIVWGFTMMVPSGHTFTPAKYKHAFLIATVFMATTGLLSIVEAFQTGYIYSKFSTIYIFGFIAYQWSANALMIKKNNI